MTQPSAASWWYRAAWPPFREAASSPTRRTAAISSGWRSPSAWKRFGSPPNGSGPSPHPQGAGSVESLASEDFCYVTTTGRRTGEPHTIEIWFGSENEATIYLLSGGGDRSDWVKNLRANPSVHVRIGDREWEGNARLVEDEDEEARVRRLLASKY